MAVFLRTLVLFCVILCSSIPDQIHGKVLAKDVDVKCEESKMTVIVRLKTLKDIAYLDQLKGYKVCAPTLENGSAVFRLDLDDFHKCGVSRLLHHATGKKVFNHRIIVENDSGAKQAFSVRCPSNHIQKREVDLPAGFQEPEVLEITKSLIERAPEPQLGVAVTQDGKEVSGEISVRPGTPLAMKVFLDKESAPVYGLMVSQLQVSDTAAQQETIVFNGCSVDPYLFDNFVTNDGDSLEARFRAFKFPDTTYVQFRGTVTVCLDKCPGAQCSNGAVGYGRKRRAIRNGDNNKLFEISLTTFIKVEDDNNEAEDVRKLLKNIKIGNQVLDLASEEELTASVREKPKNIERYNSALTTASSSSSLKAQVFTFLVLCLSLLAVRRV